VLLAATLILPKLAEPVDISTLSEAELRSIRAGELEAVMGPYLGLAVALLLIAAVIATQRASGTISSPPSPRARSHRAGDPQ
jgi:FHS family L-fucose permease-like MFS transporter